MNRNRFAVMLRILWLALMGLGVSATARAGLFEERIVNRPNYWGHAFPVYVISNIPQETVMPPVCGAALHRNNHCRYVPLASLGTHGRKQRDLLPYNAEKDTETVLVVDRAALTDVDRRALAALLHACYPRCQLSDDPQRLLIWVQNSGKSGREYQVFIDLPDARWLPHASALLWAAPTSRLADKSRDAFSIEKTAQYAAILSNDAESARALTEALPYTLSSVYAPERYTAFLQDRDATQRFIVLNWNGDAEVPAAWARQFFPGPLTSVCEAQQLDRMGISGWQRFTREAVARAYQEDGGTTWVITAPTSRHLRKLVSTVVARKFDPVRYRVNLCDLSHIQSLAVGAHVDAAGVERDRLVLQQQMEEIVQAQLRVRVSAIVSTANWGRVLEEALRRDAGDEHPFSRPTDVHYVNQAAQSDAVLLLMVKTVNPHITYAFPRERVTQPHAPFTEDPPRKPSPPDPDARRYGLFGPHVYPGETSEERRLSDAYQRDWREWRHREMPAWEDDYRRWEWRRQEWEEERRHRRVHYRFTVTSTPSMALSGYLKVIDPLGTQQVLWSTDLDLAHAGDAQHVRVAPVDVVGEDVEPEMPYELRRYTNLYQWEPCARAIGDDALYGLGQQALLQALRTGVARLADAAIWPGDLQPWSRAHASSNGEMRPAELPEGAQGETVFGPDAFLEGDIPLVPLREIAAWLRLQQTLDAPTDTLTLRRGTRAVVLKPGCAAAVVDGRAMTLSALPVERGGTLLLPVDILSEAFAVGIDFERARHMLLLRHPDSQQRMLLRVIPATSPPGVIPSPSPVGTNE
jgi:hypothetical protein